MRIAVWHNLPSGGGKRALYDHVRGLVAAGHHVEAWAPPTRDPDYLPLTDIVPEHIVPFEYPSTRTFAEQTQMGLHSARVAQRMDDHCRECVRQIEAEGFDVLFANSCRFLRVTGIGRFASIPSVLYLQEPYRWLYEAMPDLVWAAPADGPLRSLPDIKARFLDVRRIREARLQVREEIANAKAFDRVLCNSYFSRESILRAYDVDAEVCYLGIDTDHFRAPADGNGKREDYVLGLGAFTREKNMRLCIEALARVPGARPALRWIGNVAAEGYLDEMKALADSRGVVLEVRSRVGEEELLRTLSRAMAMVYAPRLEPFGLAPLEAGACGTAVIAVAEGGVRETVVDGVNGLLVDGRADAMAAAIVRLRDHPDEADALGRRGRALVAERWGLDAANARLMAKLESSIGHRNG